MTAESDDPDDGGDETLEKLHGLLSHPDAAIRLQAIELTMTLGRTAEFVRIERGRLVPPRAGMNAGVLELGLRAHPGEIEDLPAVVLHDESTLDAIAEHAPKLRRATIYWEGVDHDAEPLSSLSHLEHLLLNGVSTPRWLPRLRALRSLDIQCFGMLPATTAPLRHLTTHTPQPALLKSAVRSLRSLAVRGQPDATLGRLAHLTRLELEAHHLKHARRGHHYPALVIHAPDARAQFPVTGERVTLTKAVTTPLSIAMQPRWVECEADAFPEFRKAGAGVLDLKAGARLPDTLSIPKGAVPGPRLMRLAAQSRVIVEDHATYVPQWIARGHRFQLLVTSPPMVPIENVLVGVDPFVDGSQERISRGAIVCLTRPQAERLQLMLNRAGATTHLASWKG